MNVAIFASAFHPSLGGVEELVRQLAHEYRRQGIGAIVLVNRWPRSLPASETIEDIPVYRLAMRMPEYNLQVRLNYALGFPFLRARMLETLRRHRINLIHVQCVSANGHYAAIAARALGLPLIVSSQGERTMDAERVYEKSPFLNKTLRRLLERADRVTACSRDTLSDLETFLGAPLGERGSVIYNGVRLADFENAEPFPSERPYIFAIGRMVPQKGFDILLRAFAQAGITSHDLMIAGDGPDRSDLERLAGGLGLAGRVRFAGRTDRPKTVALFAGCSFFVLPSRQEPMGIVNLEAMAAGKAVVASRTGGAREVVVEGETGLLAAPGDAGELAAALRRMAGDPALRQTLGQAGRQRAQNFDWSAIAAAYRNLYADALAARGSTIAQPVPIPSFSAK